MESRRPTGLEARRARMPLPPIPRLCLRPDEEGANRAFVELTCAGCTPGGCALAIGRGPGRDPEGRRRAMSRREDDAKRRRAFAEGLLPTRRTAKRELPDGKLLEAHIVEPEALARIAVGEQSAWDVLAAEALAEKCFGRGCAVADGNIESCPGWCAMAIAGSVGWVMASWVG